MLPPLAAARPEAAARAQLLPLCHGIIETVIHTHRK